MTTPQPALTRVNLTRKEGRLNASWNVRKWLHTDLNRRLTYFRFTSDSGHSMMSLVASAQK